MLRFSLVLAVLVGWLSACATSGAPHAAHSPSGDQPGRAAAEQATPTAGASEPGKGGRARARDPEEHYRRVMERAARRGIRVIWINPPQQTASNHVSPPTADR